jgi:hypothetical protein
VIDALEQVNFPIGKQRVDLWMMLQGSGHRLPDRSFRAVGGRHHRSAADAGRNGGFQPAHGRRAVAKSLLTVIAIVASLALVGIDMTALSVFTGALGVGLGFGLQKIASNYVSGFIILLDRSIRIGNVIQVGADNGMVTQITTRYTVLRHPGGTEFIVPNETLIRASCRTRPIRTAACVWRPRSASPTTAILNWRCA